MNKEDRNVRFFWRKKLFPRDIEPKREENCDPRKILDQISIELVFKRATIFYSTQYLLSMGNTLK